MSESPSNNQSPIPLLLHLPKCGGTTLSNCLYEMCSSWEGTRAEEGYLVDGVYYYPEGFEKDEVIDVPQQVRRALGRDDLAAVTGHFSFGIHEYVSRPCKYVTLLRDPVDRVVSLYYHIRKYRDRKLHDAVDSQDIDLVEFVRDLRIREVDNDQTRRISGIEPAFGECTEEMLEIACENLRNHFSVVSTTDRFDEMLILLQDAFGWKYVPVYRRGLVNPSRRDKAALSPNEIEAVLERNQLDLQLYRFAGRLLDEKIAAAGPEFPRRVKEFQAANDAAFQKHLQAEQTGATP